MPTRADQSSLLTFLHIPKNGGSTLNHIIGRQYPWQTVFWFSYDRPELVSQFEAMDEKQWAELRCLGGHFPFGIHEECPRTASYITMLRDPVARFISEYGHLQRGERSGRWWPPRDRLKSLADFLDYRIETNGMDVQTRFISGNMPAPGAEPPLDPLPVDALERAKENLKKHFIVVGLTDRFDESLLLMKDRLDWQSRIFYSRKNTAPQPTSYADIPADVLDRITEHTQIDAELVRFAGELLDEAISEEGEAFQKDLRKLQRVNHTLFMLKSTLNRVFPPAVRNAPGIRHVSALGHKLLR